MDQVEEFWNHLLPTLESMFLNPDGDFIDSLERPEIIRLLPSYEGMNVLELASGIGRFTGEFAKSASYVTAVDLVPQFIEQNRQNNASFSNIDYLCMDARKLDFPSQTFDLIFVHSLFMYIEDDQLEEFVTRIASWLKKGGYLFFRESCSPCGRTIKTPLLGKTYRAHHRSIESYHRLMDQRLTLLKTGSVQTFIDHLADPFKCYWLYHLEK